MIYIISSTREDFLWHCRTLAISPLEDRILHVNTYMAFLGRMISKYDHVIYGDTNCFYPGEYEEIQNQIRMRSKPR